VTVEEPCVKQELAGIYVEHRQGLFTLALSIVRDPERAQDAVHDAFARLCRTAHRPTGDLTAYVFAAVRNAAIDICRRSPPGTVSIFETEGDSPEPSPAAQVAEHERDQLVRRELEKLPDAQKQVIMMKIYGELTFEQIAQSLGEPLQTVASRYRRALARLRETMESFV
jgi:RNA polymerase sigma-70 factor (ECF subfamily)